MNAKFKETEFCLVRSNALTSMTLFAQLFAAKVNLSYWIHMGSFTTKYWS